MKSIAVAQLGARMHYAVPRIFHEAGVLDCLYTDVCATKGWSRALPYVLPKKWQPNELRRFTGRVPRDIPLAKIKAFTTFGWEYAWRRRAARTAEKMTSVHLWAGETFNKLVLEQGINNADTIYTFNSAGLEVLLEAKKQGLFTIVEQTIAPKLVERSLLDPEYSSYCLLSEQVESKESWKRFADREAAEWAVADKIICGSQFVVDGILQAGGPVDKTIVVPYGIDFERFNPPVRNFSLPRQLHVLFVGEVGIRKGAHYLIEAARILDTKLLEIQFTFVGRLALPKSIMSSLPSNVHLMGVIPRSGIRDQFASADIFCLPSLCEGSATVIYEALAMGLPVICTPNAGSLVEDGKEGYVVPIRDPESIAERILCLKDANCREAFALAALEKAKDCSIESYSERLLSALKQ